MKPTVKVNTRGLSERLKALDKAGLPASTAAIRVMGQEFGRSLLLLSAEHSDTNRYYRGWCQAINQAGLGPVFVPDVVDSKYADWLQGRLELRVEKFKKRAADKKRSAEFWQRVYDNRYGRVARRGKWERDCAAKRDRAAKKAEKAEELLRRAEETLKNFDPKGIVIWGRNTYDGKVRFREVHTQRLKVYGGTGYLMARVGDAYLVLHNLEAHASIVERQFRIVARAFASVKRPGVRRSARDAAVKELIKANRKAAVAATR